MIIGYIQIDINDSLVGNINIKINDKIVTRKIDNYKIENCNFGEYTDRILEAVETSKFLREYYTSKGQEHNPSCVVIREIA